MNNIAIVWKYDDKAAKKTALKVCPATPKEMESLEKKYPQPKFAVQGWGVSGDKIEGVEEGETYPADYDPMDWDIED